MVTMAREEQKMAREARFMAKQKKLRYKAFASLKKIQREDER